MANALFTPFLLIDVFREAKEPTMRSENIFKQVRALSG